MEGARGSVLGLIAALLLTPAAPFAARAVPMPDYALTLQSEIPRLMQANVIPGAVVLIRSPRRGDWSAAFGTRALGTSEPMTRVDHFRVGSNTKTMTATVILQLVQEGKLRLDDPVAKYVAGVPNGERITIANLLEMRSGLYSYTLDPTFNATLDRDPGKVWTPQELLAIGFSRPPAFAPGARFDYSNTNYVLLGVLLEQLTGLPAAEAFHRRLFQPLGLAQTSLPAAADASIPAPHPRGYAFGTNVSTIRTNALPPQQQAAALAGRLQPRDETDANPSWGWTAGGAISTAGDLATWVKALVSGNLLDPAMQRKRLASIRPTEPGNSAGADYGLGIVRFGPQVYGHDGQLPGFMSFMGHDPRTGDTIVVATNLATVPSGEGAALVLAKAIMRVLYGDAALTSKASSSEDLTAG
ncbi:MAG: serine hydrolase domain-containing protein [Cyanobacteriota bacterium]|jgi:D-alanyl-D-alanine carboxypeptidase